MALTRWRRLGVRREVLILFPVALVLLAALTTFTLFAYRNALKLLVEERQAQAARLARLLSSEASGAPPPSVQDLRRRVPEARGVALLDGRGEPLAASGDLPPGNLLAGLAEGGLGQAAGFGPDRALPDRVVGLAPLGPPEGRRYLRLDLPAGALASQVRSLEVLSLVVLTVTSVLVLLVLLYLRHLLAPFESLLARAREAGAPEPRGEDEVAFLLSTFEQAMAALVQPRERGVEEDIAALERTLAASLESGLLLLDREGNVLALNEVGAGLLGIPAPPPLPAPLGQVLASRPELADLLADAVARERALQRHELAVASPRGPRILGLTAHPLRRDDRSLAGYIVLFADLTEAKRQADESRLAESLAQIGELAAGVAHELRNGLGTLRGYLTLIARRPEEGSAADYLAEMRRETDHLHRVLEDFLSFARPGSARLEDVDLARVVRRAAADPVLAPGAVVLDDGGRPVPPLRGDPVLLERAVRNLLHNACQAQAEGGVEGAVEARLSQGEEGLELAIEDRGPGLPQAVRERLFVPFVSARPGGVGLGLAVAHRIVTLHGGAIQLTDRPGGGTRAVIRFPESTLVTKGNSRDLDPGSPSDRQENG